MTREGNGPLFSVIIPTYNRSDLVQLAIRSVLRQSFADFELLVSDNWSQDDTEAVIRGLDDERIRYIRPPEHVPIPDHWEWARQQVSGRLTIILADDDALLPVALQRFAELHGRHGADFMFSSFAEYRDRMYPGPLRNTLECERFPGRERLVDLEEFVGTLFSFRPAFNLHPSAYAFSAELAESIARRSGRFFKTIGVEYYAWPAAAGLARRAVHAGVPLTVTGRAAKSWGTNMVLVNPGKEKIAQFLSDVSKAPRRVPLDNYTFINLMAEGMLQAKSDFPGELGGFEFNEREYLRQTLEELRHRQASGVDVSTELEEVTAYRTQHPELEPIEVRRNQPPLAARLKREARRGAQRVRDRIQGVEACWGFSVSGEDYGFTDIIECADFLAKLVATPALPLRRRAPSRFGSGAGWRPERMRDYFSSGGDQA